MYLITKSLPFFSNNNGNCNTILLSLEGNGVGTEKYGIVVMVINVLQNK